MKPIKSSKSTYRQYSGESSKENPKCIFTELPCADHFDCRKCLIPLRYPIVTVKK